jgi:hypothetical protein
MSLHEYRAATRLARADLSFYALIMGAMLRADSDNIERLKLAFPETWAELDARYSGAGGRIPGDPDYEQAQRNREALGMPPT